MLSAKQIADRIHKPELIQKEDISFLKELAEKHPYTQIYSILYLKALGDNADIHFEEELQKHSYRISDRSQLFKLIHDFSSDFDVTPNLTTEETETIIEEKEIIETPPTTIVEVVSEKIITEEPIIKEEVIIDDVPELIQEIQKETVAVEIENEKPEINLEDDVITENSQEIIHDAVLAQEIEETQIKIPSDALDESILHHSFAANYQLSELSKEEIEALEKRKIEKEIPEIIIEKPVGKSPVEIEISATQSFTSWLNSNRNKTEASNDEKLEIEAIVKNSSLTFEINEFFGEVVKPKKEFFSPIKKAKESLSEEALPVSETLAKVYALQGNFPKAIYAYEQLSLKYPEKKIFFAIQIKELQKKLNS